MGGRELFVWYRVPSERRVAARAAVVAMQESLAARFPGLRARLLVRDGGESSTWMETYACSGPSGTDGVDAALEAAIAAAAVPFEAFVDGPRHVEAFDALA